MKILNLRPSGAGAAFDVQLTPEIELRDWSLKLTAAGWRAFQPAVRGGRTPIWLAPEVLNEITRQARKQLEGDAPNERHT